MSKEEEIRSIEAEPEFIQNEIDRRHGRGDTDTERARNLEKIASLNQVACLCAG